MATTLGQILGRARFRLAGVGAIEDASAELTTALTPSATSVVVDSAVAFSPGVVEVDFELIRVKSVNGTDNILMLPAFGRGYKGTAAAAHAVGAEVTYSPIWPKGVVAQEINGVLLEVYPDLYAVKAVNTTIPSDYGPLTLPTDAVGVVSVWAEPSAVPGTWDQTEHWDFQPDGSATGRTLRLRFGYAGQPVRVVYAARPGIFDLGAADPLTQDFATVTGLPERTADLIALGVAARLAPFIPLGRLAEAGAEARADAPSRPDPNAVARLLYSEFRARVQAEQAALVKEHPVKLHKVGWVS